MMTAFDNLKFSGYVMRKDEIVATIENNRILDISVKAPLYLQNYRNFMSWINDRGADISRSNMRIILRHLGYPLQDIRKAVISVNAACINDSFWIREKMSVLKYTDVKFKSDKYMKAALIGDPDIFSLEKETTPEIANIGSFNKGWKLRNNKWFLYKTGTKLEIFSELFTSKLAIELNLNAVAYYIDGGFIVCENFTKEGKDFESAKSLIGTDTSYPRVTKILQSLGLMKEYLDIIYMDAIVRNADRHEFNYGFLTAPGGLIELAPNFDNNLSLFCKGIPNNLDRKDPLVTDFVQLLQEMKISYSIPNLTEEIIREAYEKTLREYYIDIPFKVVETFCMNAQKQIEKA
jgi:hypothetical protein